MPLINETSKPVKDPYHTIIAPQLKKLATQAKKLGLSTLFVVDYADGTGVHGILREEAMPSAILTLGVMAARSGGDFDKFITLLRELGLTHTSTCLTLLGFPPNGEPLGHSLLYDQLAATLDYARRLNLQGAVEYLTESLIKVQGDKDV